MKKVKYLVAVVLVLTGLSLGLVSKILVAHTAHIPAASLIVDADDPSDPHPDGPGYWD